ncbi:hypothetical protein DFP72DRAFT_862610 [Ephemerocybe angulata]|uniref:Uncharacterized protein n=1 Tax=Ephemerocybe angulata TaxID=980116 RepID=A0A8H6LT63_9AGAR|nr:hypothetical protein DFP72DRAFT_862610 [Tulosesus angulatus]
MPPKKKVVCTCISAGCHRREFENEFGDVQPGNLVASNTRKTHEDKDLKLGLDRRNPSIQLNRTPRGPRKTSLEPLPEASSIPAKQREENGTSIPLVSGLGNRYRQSIFTVDTTVDYFRGFTVGASNNNPSSPPKGTTPGESDSESGCLNSQTKDPRSIEQGKARQRRDTRQQEQRHSRHSEFSDRVGKTRNSAWAASDLDVSREAVSSAPGCPTTHGKRITGITGVSPSKCKGAPQRRVQAREG